MPKGNRKRVSVKRAIRAFGRKSFSYGELRDSDYRWLYVAYQEGVFDGISIPEDLEPVGFLEFFKPLQRDYGLVVYRGRGGKPLIMFVFTSFQTAVKEIKTFPMPWATCVSNVLCAVHFYGRGSQSFNLASIVKEDEAKFFRHLIKYGVVRKVGIIENAFDGLDGYYFQGKKMETPWLKPLNM